MNRETDLINRAAAMWLEYAAEGDDVAIAATGHNADTCMWIAHGLLTGHEMGIREHSAHMAKIAIDNARYATPDDEKK